MTRKLFWAMALQMFFTTGPAYAGKAVQMWHCGMEDDVSEEAIEEHATKWLAAEKQVEGGENIEAYVPFPVAVNATGDTDMLFVVTMPTFAEWGKFWDAYPDSQAAAAESGHVFCPDSVLRESVKIK